jgi:hypothetical protein
MGLITGLLTLPLAPVRGVVWVAEAIQQQAEKEMDEPSRLRAELHELQVRREFGLDDDAESDAREDELIRRILAFGSRGYPEVAP